MTDGPVLLWLRRDLRLGDNPALAAAVETGRLVIPVFIRPRKSGSTARRRRCLVARPQSRGVA